MTRPLLANIATFYGRHGTPIYFSTVAILYVIARFFIYYGSKRDTIIRVTRITAIDSSKIALYYLRARLLMHAKNTDVTDYVCRTDVRDRHYDVKDLFRERSASI